MWLVRDLQVKIMYLGLNIITGILSEGALRDVTREERQERLK